MWIKRKDYQNLIDRYEKRIDDLLNRLMSTNFSEYKFVKEHKISELPEPTSRTDEDEYNIEKARFNDLKELEEKSEGLRSELSKPFPRIMK